MALPKWTDERTQQLVDFVGDSSPVTQAMVAEAAEDLETSTRSVSSKLRKMGFDVELASASASKSFSEEQEATLSNFVQDNSGAYTYAEIADDIGKTVRGVKTMLTRRGLQCADYNGAARKEIG